MPWDPAAPMPNPSPAPSTNTVGRTPSQQAVTPVPLGASSNDVHIKPEPGTGYDLQNLPPTNGLPSSYSNQAALQRAGQQLQEKFGSAATAQVNQLQARAELASQNAQSQPRPVNPAQLSEEQRRLYQQQMEQAHLRQQQQKRFQELQQAQQRNTVGAAQTDGAGDWAAMVAERRAALADGSNAHADQTIRQRIEEMALAMEGGGLLLPLAQQPKRKRGSGPAAAYPGASEPIVIAESSTTPQIPQHDGANDSEDDKTGVKDEDDEDAINSDLDDPDDNVVEETEDDANQGDVMLCTYDKVQRVKNKWKCTLKDGVLSTGGKE